MGDSPSPSKSVRRHPPQPPRGFLPLHSDDDVLSTRGQKLPRLIQSGSSAQLKLASPRRRRPNMRDEEENHGEPPERPSEHDGSTVLADAARAITSPKMRSMRLIGDSSRNPRYNWEQYRKSEEQLKAMKKPLRKYYERTNYLIEQYIYIDRLLDSSLPHDLIQDYNNTAEPSGPAQSTTDDGSPTASSSSPTSVQHGEDSPAEAAESQATNGHVAKPKRKRTPQALYKIPDEATPLLTAHGSYGEDETSKTPCAHDIEEGDSEASVVRVAIYINLAANTILLASKVVALVLTSSLSVLAGLVDAALDFLSTAIVWTTTTLISRRDQYAYPVGRRRLEPIGVLVFSVIMITSFFQVLLESFSRLTSGDRTVVQLTLAAILIMLSTVVVKFLCWLWCRLINNSSVQALAQDAITDVVFNTFSIIFPLVGYYLKIWWLDAVGGAVLSLYVILNWSRTSTAHIRNLSGAAASADQCGILLYLTMRFASAIRHVQGLQAYHAGDRLNVEVDVVLDEKMSLRDSHDLGESLQYVLEAVPFVDRAFVHLDYKGWNLPSHLNQD